MSQDPTPSGESEFRKILERARSGDASAWGELFSRLGDEHDETGAAALAIARKALPRDHWARDLVESRDILQSALRVGWLKAEQFRGESEGEFYGWIRSILRNKVSRAGRRQDARSRDLVADMESVQPPGSSATDEDPLEAVIEEEVRTKVRQALDQLPEDQREVMDLFLQGLKAPEIASLLAIKPATVRKRESRAREKLREILGVDAP